MKLRNLMYATMIACAFASCSNDDVPTPDNGNPDVEGGTSLALKIDQPTTKAGGGDIRNLTVLVFNGAGTNDIKLEKKATVEEEGTDEVLQTKLTPGNKTVLVLANAKDEVATFNEETTSYQNVLDATTKFELYSETDGDFSMNSKAYEVTLKANVTNYLGYGLSGDKEGNYLPQAGDGAVKMYRNVAKVVLKGIKIKESVAEGQQYPNAELKLKEIFILHGHNNSKLVGQRTLLVLKGTYIDNNGKVEKDRFYTISVNDPNRGYTLTEGEDVPKHSFVKRNYRYNISLTIKSSGSDRPYDPASEACMDVAVTVADWDVIEQNEDLD